MISTQHLVDRWLKQHGNLDQHPVTEDDLVDLVRKVREDAYDDAVAEIATLKRDA